MQKQLTLKIRQILKNWYDIYKRDLPWRDTSDAYKIWISEIILQQTRVNQGYGYYLRFIERFQDVISLAEADEQEVLKYWQGLGYYSRARNLHKAARMIAADFEGKFPTDYKNILSLPGIGEYTAAAISSFAYDQPYATVDGNIYRVLARLTGCDTPIDTSKGKKIFTDKAQNLLDKSAPALHNQAIMEFGALQCTPVSPDCTNCPLNIYCVAFNQNTVQQLPVKQGKVKVSNRYFNYFFIRNEEYTYLQKRTKKDIWRNLYELPLIETDTLNTTEELSVNNEFIKLFSGVEKISFNHQPIKIKHVLSHQIIYASFYNVHVNGENTLLTSLTKVSLDEISQYPIARLTDLFFEKELKNK